jgi:sulfite oxidase
MIWKSTVVLAEVPGDSNTKLIRLAEVKKHGQGAETIWVTRENRVYDITDWIEGHPGGDVILRAAGSSIEPYWQIFAIHQKQDVYDILEQYYIGLVDPRDLIDGAVPTDAIDDPFHADPKRDPRLHVHTDRPCNAETLGPDLDDFITPNELFYVRNHLWVPQAGEDEHKLVVELADGTEKEYTVPELRKRFTEHSITATLQCSGNRRNHMTRGAAATNGLQWQVGAIGNAVWTGVRLRDVLADAGFPVDDVPEDVKHTQFVGSEAYGASIPIEKAVSKRGDVLLAYAMNGEALSPDHGFPLRVIAPGHVAARSVKWVRKIMLSDEESTSQWQRRDYKCFGPNEGRKPDWDKARSIQETPVQSAITSVTEVSSHTPQERKIVRAHGLEEDAVVLKGYAISGGGREIIRVDVSLDDGDTWRQAEIQDDGVEYAGNCWSWKRWECVIAKSDVKKGYLVKAVDEAYNSQPETHPPTFNYRGNLATAWHRIPVIHS